MDSLDPSTLTLPDTLSASSSQDGVRLHLEHDLRSDRRRSVNIISGNRVSCSVVEL